jgi:DNA-binding beta-propeller fold protein YncE
MRYIFVVIILFLILSCKDKETFQTKHLDKPSVLVINGGENSISIIEPENFQERHRLFIPSPNNTFIHHIGLNSTQTKFALAFPEYDFADGHDGLHDLQVKGYVTIYDRNAETVERTFQVPFANHNAVFSPDNSEVWTGLVSHAGRVMVYNANNGTLIKEITVGADPHEVLFSEDGKYVVTSCMESSFMTVIDPKTKTVLKEIKVDPFPTNVWHGKDANQIIVENANQKSINFVDLNTLQTTDHIDLDFAPGFSKFAPNGELWICAKGQNFLSVYKKESNLWNEKSRILTENDPHQLMFYNGNTWLVNQKQNTVQIFNTESKEKLGGLNVGQKPNAIVFIP